jgi:ElaB/YqjD/DUF883 family membrane-anchored ribosome-binding protein
MEVIMPATRNTHHRGVTRRNGFASLRRQAATVGDDVRQLAATAGETVVQQMDPIAEYVQQKPLRSLLIAAAVGAFCGLVLLRR